MDFASGLANLEQTAENAKNRRRNRDNNSNNNNNTNSIDRGSVGGGGDDQRRFQPRPRRGYDQSNYYGTGGGRGGGGNSGRGSGGDRSTSSYHGRQHQHQQQSSSSSSSHQQYNQHQQPYRSHQHQHQQQYYHHDRSLDGLARFGYRLPRGPYRRPPPLTVTANSSTASKTTTSASTSASDPPVFHICLLAISIDDLPYEAIWREWATASSTATSDATTNNGSNSRFIVSLVCHAKHPERVQSEWLKQRMLLQPRRVVRGNSLSDPEFLSYQPAWGSIDITRAMIDLLVQGMSIGKRSSSRKGASNSTTTTTTSSHGSKTTTTTATTSSNTTEDARFSANRFLITNPAKSAQELTQQDVPSVDKFIFISETCMPVTTLEECGNALFPTTTTTAGASTAVLDTTRSETSKESTTETKETTPEASKERESSNSDDKKEATFPTASDTAATTTASNDEKDKESKNAKPTTTTTTANTVIDLDTSWVNARNFNSPNTPQNKYERDQFDKIHRVIPKRYRWKADQWMVLSRVHAAALLDIDHSSSSSSNNNKSYLWKSFRQINASDEMYFPTALALAGILIDTTTRSQQYRSNHHQQQLQHQSQATATTSTATATATTNTNNDQQDETPWLQRRRVTYTDWSMGMRNPASFTKGIKDFAKVARLARQQGCLLARKFAPFLEIPGQDASTMERTGDISAEEWKQEMETILVAEQNSKAAK